MIGFLAVGALSGLAAVGWPVYLHMRRRQKPVVQVVPSLLLFALVATSRRKRALERIPLLVARTLFLGSLAAVVAQPFVVSERPLPLMRLDEHRPGESCIGILVDDSLSSLHGASGATRLDSSVEWLRERLVALPDHARVVIALTSFPSPTRALEPKEAVELLGKLRAIPRPGDATVALSRLWDRLRGRSAAIVLASPRDSALWRKLEDGTDLAVKTRVHVLDTSAVRLPWHIHSASPAGSGGGASAWAFTFAGDRRAMAGERLRIEDAQGRAIEYSVTRADAERGRAVVVVPAEGSRSWHRAAIDGLEPHPWASWYACDAEGAESGPPKRLVIVRPMTREGLLADKVVTAALTALYPECAIHHTGPREAVFEKPVRGSVVWIGSPASGPDVESWLESVLGPDGRLLCFPSGRHSERDDATGMLPCWGGAELVVPSESFPLVRPENQPSCAAFLDDLLLDGLSQARYSRLQAPRFTGVFDVAASTGNGVPFLATRGAGARRRTWACAVPLTLDAGSVVYHPAFPLMLERILFGEDDATRDAPLDARVGDTVDVARWFRVDTTDGVLSLPDADARHAPVPAAGVARLSISHVGPHVLELPEATVTRVANYPRLPVDDEFSRQVWASKRPNTDAVWLTWSDDLPSIGSAIVGAGDLERAPRYDLSSIVLVLLALCLLAEGFLLLKQSVRGEAAHG